MASVGTALPPVAPAKPPKKRGMSQSRKTGPTVSDRILKTMSAERGSVSLAALKKALAAGGYDVGKNKVRILIAIKRLVANKSLVRTKGIGASGSFKVNKKPPTPRNNKVVKKKKPMAKKVKGAGLKKAAGDATPAAKKSPKKKRKAKSPKKAKRPAVAKKPKKPNSPKRAKRTVVRSTRTTRAAAKK